MRQRSELAEIKADCLMRQSMRFGRNLKRENDMSNKEKYQNIFVNIFNVDAKDLNDTFNFKDVEKWDSLTHLTLISELEDAFDIMFETDDILHFGGYVNGMKTLARYGVEF